MNTNIYATVERLYKHPLINLVDISFMSYRELPEIRIQSKRNVSVDEVVALVGKELSPVSLFADKIDFEFSNCWGASYYGKTDEFTIKLITSTTKEEAIPESEVEAYVSV